LTGNYQEEEEEEEKEFYAQSNEGNKEIKVILT
jgi:hypothetical protein